MVFFVFCSVYLWNDKKLLKRFASSPPPLVGDWLQLHNGVVTFRKCPREMWDCRSDGGVSGGGQSHDEEWGRWCSAAAQTMEPANQNQTRLRPCRDTLTLILTCPDIFHRRQLSYAGKSYSILRQKSYSWKIGFLGTVAALSCKSGLMVESSETWNAVSGQKHYCVQFFKALRTTNKTSLNSVEL